MSLPGLNIDHRERDSPQVGTDIVVFTPAIVRNVQSHSRGTRGIPKWIPRLREILFPDPHPCSHLSERYFKHIAHGNVPLASFITRALPVFSRCRAEHARTSSPECRLQAHTLPLATSGEASDTNTHTKDSDPAQADPATAPG